MTSIAITGHTSGLGKSFYDICLDKGLTVKGFSRRNGYDLRDYAKVTKMIDEIKDFDFFISNAKPDYTQTQILYRLCQDWQQGTIISIGSKVIEYPPTDWTDLGMLEYCTQKMALAHAHQVLEPIAQAKLILVNPNHLGDATNEYAEQLLEELVF